MSVAALIAEFSSRHSIPIEIEEVIAWIRARGIKDEIYAFWDVDLDPATLRGYIKHDQYITDATGVEKQVAEITYAKMGHELERLVCTKELLHVIDPVHVRVSDPADINRLIEKIVLPSDLVDPKSDGVRALSDRVAIIEACAVLFPLAAREAFRPLYPDKYSLAMIADAVEIPPRYAAIVMSDEWDDIHKLLLIER